MEFELTESEAQRYDRQIRVWGAEAQSRIQNSKVLVCGMSKMNVEVVKNIVLAGMNVTLQGSRSATYDDLSHNFFLTTEDVGTQIVQAVLPRVQELNSFAKILSEERSIDNLPDEFFTDFSVILLTEASETQAIRINNICRKNNPDCVFFWSEMFGDEGLFYADFGKEFTYKDDKQPGTTNNTIANTISTTSTEGVKDTTTPTSAIKHMVFPSLESVLARRWSEVVSRFFPLSRTFVKHRLLCAFSASHGRLPDSTNTTDITSLQEHLTTLQTTNNIPNDNTTILTMAQPQQLEHLCRVAGSASVLACSILGSFLSQEVVKAVSHTGEPAFNVFVFSGEDLEAKAFPIR